MDKISELDSVLTAFSKEIQLALANSDWSGLEALLSRRQKILEVFFQGIEAENNKPAIKALIMRVQDEDKRFLQNLQEQKKQTEEQLRTLRQGQESVKAYNDV